MIHKHSCVRATPLNSVRTLIVLFAFWLTTRTVHAAPNIVLMLADDAGAECFDFFGGTYGTPAVDRLATRGVLFTHAFSQPMCTPSRLQILSGVYNVRNYISMATWPTGETTFAHQLKAAGYTTCVAGKWQLSAPPPELGFDRHIIWERPKRRNQYVHPTLVVDGVETYYEGGYGPKIVNEYVQKFIATAPEPWLLYYPLILPHYPFQPTPPSRDWSIEPGAELVDDPKYFAPMVRYMDRMVKRTVNRINKTGQRRRTVIVFTSDNGCENNIVSRLADGSLVEGGKRLTLDRGVHVPLIVSRPGTIAENWRTEAVVDFVDFLPTLLELAELPLAADYPGDGESIWPLIAGPFTQRTKWFSYSWYRPFSDSTLVTSIRSHDYRLYGDGRFYDVVLDPEEQFDLPRDYDPVAYDAMSVELQRLDSAGE